MSNTTTVRISGASDDLVEFDGSIYGEAYLPASGRSRVTLKAPDGTKMRLEVVFCGDDNPEGWDVFVKDNPGDWLAVPFSSHMDEPDWGLVVTVPEGTTAKCDGKKVR